MNLAFKYHRTIFKGEGFELESFWNVSICAYMLESLNKMLIHGKMKPRAILTIKQNQKKSGGWRVDFKIRSCVLLRNLPPKKMRKAPPKF